MASIFCRAQSVQVAKSLISELNPRSSVKLRFVLLAQPQRLCLLEKSGARPMAADFYPVLARAIADLNANTEEARAVLFARAREALVALPSTNLSVAHLDLSAEVAALEAAIECIEWENRPDQTIHHAGSEQLPADLIADQPQTTDTRSVDASNEFIEPESDRLVEADASEPNIADLSYVTESVDKRETENEDDGARPLQEPPAFSSQRWPALPSERHKTRTKPKAFAAAAVILFFGVLGYAGISGTRGPSGSATRPTSTVQPNAEFLSKLQVHGIKLRMDGYEAADTVEKSLQAEYGAIHNRLWDWKVCSPQAEKAMSTDGVDRTGWLKKYCFAIISFGEASSADRAKLHLVEDPASYKSIVGSFQLTLGSSSNAVDPELVLKEAISQYGEPQRIRSPSGRPGRCLVWGGEDQVYLEFCAESCCVAITFEDQDLIRYATLDYDRRMGIIARPASQ
jgi:hypothetical protein